MNFKKNIYLGFIFSLILIVLFSSCGNDCKFNSITTDNLPDAIVGQKYSAKINYDITCSYASKSVEQIDGVLPDGIDMDGSGEFTGTPTKAGTYKFKIKLQICFGTNGFNYTDCTDKIKEITLKVNEK